MPLSHAIVSFDHNTARLLQFDAGQLEVHKIKSHAHYTKQHGSNVRSEHEFYAEVCDAIKGIDEVLVTGSHTAITDFMHYVHKHRAAQTKQIIDSLASSHQTDGQLVAWAKECFLKHERMQGTAPLGKS